jgi:hypothetical protein
VAQNQVRWTTAADGTHATGRACSGQRAYQHTQLGVRSFEPRAAASRLSPPHLSALALSPPRSTAHTAEERTGGGGVRCGARAVQLRGGHQRGAAPAAAAAGGVRVRPTAMHKLRIESVCELSCREAAAGIPESARGPLWYTQLVVLARPLTRTSPRGGESSGCES